MTNKEAKQRYFDKVYENAPIVKCACGCGTDIKSKDRYGRDKNFVNGHNGRKYPDSRQYKREWNYRNRDQRYAYKAEWLLNFKKKLVEYKGGKCNRCEYTFNGNNAKAFDFHHTDPNSKDFTISSSMNRRSVEALYAEIDKCELLCAICHRLHHS